MITQEYKQGSDIIRIETAETLDDAEKNNFQKGIYSRCYVNNKLVDNYMAMIRFIVDNVKKNKQNIIPAKSDLIKQREQMLDNQRKMMIEQIEAIKKEYGNINDNVTKQLDGIIDKINLEGVRVSE